LVHKEHKTAYQSLWVTRTNVKVYTSFTIRLSGYLTSIKDHLLIGRGKVPAFKGVYKINGQYVGLRKGKHIINL